MKKLIITTLISAIALMTNAQTVTVTGLHKVVSDVRQAGAQMGYTVAMDGDYAVVSARLASDDGAGSNVSKAGVVHIYKYNGSAWVRIQKITASDREVNDYYGASVDIDGDWIIVGSEDDHTDLGTSNFVDGAGSAYLYKNNGSDVFVQQQKIAAANTGGTWRRSFDRFGGDVAISGNYAIVGAKNYDYNVAGTGYESSAGAAYIFELSGGTWTQINKFVCPTNRDGNDGFGYSVDIDGDRAIVGARGRDPGGNSGVGELFVYDRIVGTWTNTHSILPSSMLSDYFGQYSVLDGDRIAVGSILDDYDENYANNIGASGSVWIFDYDGTNWSETQKIVDPVRGASEYFGSSVALDGNYLIVSSRNEDNDENEANSLTDAGSAFLYEYDGTNWILSEKFVASDRDADDEFGSINGVAISGNMVVVGSYLEDDDLADANPLADAGSAYFFEIGPILPVELISFNAGCDGATAQLNWVTATEISNDYFTIERSTDAVNFEEVATVNGHGNTSIMINYNWTDDNPLDGTAYYRLKQTDFNGAFEYHGIRTVSCKQDGNISVYPNPFENSFTVQLSDNTTYPITVEVMDYLGRKVYAKQVETSITKIDLNDLPSSTYFVKVFNETTQLVKRIVKTK